MRDSGRPCSRTIVPVSLFDDLTGRLQLGDSLAVIGHASMATSSANLPPNYGYLFAELRIKANNIFAPYSLNSLKLSTPGVHTIFRRKDGMISLEKLSKTICHGPGTKLWPKFLAIALLLSLVASDSNSDPATSLLNSHAGKVSRKQIHVLLATTSSFSSANSLQSLQAAALYASRSMYDEWGNDVFVNKVKVEDPSGDKQMFYSGSLSLSSGGVLVLDLSLLSKSKSKILSEAMENPAGQRRCNSDSSLPRSTSIWASQEIPRGPANESLPFCESFGSLKAKPIHPALLRNFDIILAEPYDLYSDRELLQNLVVDINDSAKSSELSTDLQQHLLTASSISSTTITSGAHDLIRSYYLAVRKNKECLQEQDDVSLLSLQSLTRVAKACARLCWRTDIVEVPDVTLAILLREITSVTKFGCRSLVPVKEELIRDASSQRTISILQDDAFDQELRWFHSKLVKFLYHFNPEE